MDNNQYTIVIDDAWFTVSQLDEGTFAISEYGHWEKVHSFLLIGDERAALIDTGLGIDDMRRMTDQLTDLPIMVLTTHVHADHIGSHGLYGEIYVHEAEEDWLVSGIKKLSIEQIRKDISRDITRPVPALPSIRQRTPLIGGGRPACFGMGTSSSLADEVWSSTIRRAIRPDILRYLNPTAGTCSLAICCMMRRRYMPSTRRQVPGTSLTRWSGSRISKA